MENNGVYEYSVINWLDITEEQYIFSAFGSEQKKYSNLFYLFVELHLRMFLKIIFFAASLVQLAWPAVTAASLSASTTNETVSGEPDYKEYAKVARYLVHKSGM